MYKKEAFSQYFVDVLGGKPSTFPTYRSYLNRIDQMIGGLDERIDAESVDAVRNWAKAQSTGPFETYASNARSILNSYLGFVQEGGEASVIEGLPEQYEPEIPAGGAAFKVEKEMQAAIRQDLVSLEPGLQAVDDGTEVSTTTGRIDILARDSSGLLVAIELKAGPCPPGAIEQVLGYAQALADERGEDTRAILIASSFNDRQRAAAKRCLDLALRTYSYQLSYSPNL